MTELAIEAVRLSEVQLNASPINPDWILHGEPVARSAEWTRTLDGTTTFNVWDCTAGRFNWYFHVDEIVHIMDGSVTVSAEGSPPRTLVAGDAALFRAGTWSEWHVSDYVRKHAILRSSLPASVARALGLARNLRGALRKVSGLGRGESAPIPRGL
ncbi:hypothetical protein BJD99_06780 [Rhodococcus sp. 1163]|uniref:cupin domain-containing protein n=1 Tax=Rhodococcus sp. 1163 TaxID=1905289 RepID=UPI0009FC8EF2|nr:cupin domain-containing protein [Rhodococcus sp. 1163]ORI20738.1 hypothetical protein BJD99_06780 [Rhodococcus sp. 1163]